MHLLSRKINKAPSGHFISPWGVGEGCVIYHLQEGWDFLNVWLHYIVVFKPCF